MIPLVLTLLLGQSLPATSQNDSTSTAPPAAVMRPVPFTSGERMDYVAKMGPMNPGRGFMEIVGIEDVRGRPAVHTRFQLKGRAFFFSANYLLESWVDQATFTSLRFTQDNDGDATDKDKVYEIFPDRQTYRVNGGAELPSVPAPLDEGALLYYVRTMDLEVGKTYDLNRYFRPDRNPVVVKVLRKETIKVPAGTFNTIVIQPIIKAKGIFSEGGKAQIYLSDDKDRIMVQMRVHLKANIDISLQLTKYTPATNQSQ
jgi:uncharacterized protein DUF3108